MTPMSHLLWFPFRESLGSFPTPGSFPTCRTGKSLHHSIQAPEAETWRLARDGNVLEGAGAMDAEIGAGAWHLTEGPSKSKLIFRYPPTVAVHDCRLLGGFDTEADLTGICGVELLCKWEEWYTIVVLLGGFCAEADLLEHRK